MRKALLAGLAFAAFAGGAPGGSAPGAAFRVEPRPLTGVALRGRSGLRLVVAERRPFVLDVDRGSVSLVAGVPVLGGGVVSVVPVGGRGAAIVRGPRVYGVAAAGVRAAALGRARAVAPSAAGDAVWIAGGTRPRCTIRAVSLSGRTIRGPRGFPCAATIAPAGRAGLVVNRTAIYDPLTGRLVLRAPAGVVAAAGTTLVLAGPGRGFTLLDAATGRRHRLRWPSVVGTADPPAADPRGRFVALGFATPTWAGGRQVLDVWILDVRSRRLTQLPGMPAFVELKATSMAWTDDGRLVLLARSAGRDLVAVWRPGARRLAVEPVPIRRPTPASDTFASIR